MGEKACGRKIYFVVREVLWMKIALCLSGIIGGFGGRDGVGEKIPVELCYEEWSKALLDHYDTDVFLHSWSVEDQEKIINNFQPTNFLFEKQKAFMPKFSDYHHKASTLEDLKKDIRYREIALEYSVDALWNHMDYMMYQTHSKYYANKQAVKLKADYEKENNFKYDLVILSRFDMHFNKVFDFANFEKNCFYASPRTDFGVKRKDYDIAVHDLFFFSNSDNMDLYSKQYDEIYALCISQPHAAKEMIDKICTKENIRHFWDYQSDYNTIRQTYSPDIIKKYK